jgi:hypothetical protein
MPTVTLTEDEANAILAALDGFEPDMANYDPEDTAPMGWSPEDVANLNAGYSQIFDALRLGS